MDIQLFVYKRQHTDSQAITTNTSCRCRPGVSLDVGQNSYGYQDHIRSKVIDGLSCSVSEDKQMLSGTSAPIMNHRILFSNNHHDYNDTYHHH